jgi:CheY-like chemotaxis protein
MGTAQKKIFIADDDADILSILQLMLQTKGYSVYATADANDIFKYQNDCPDLILLDIWMPVADGRDICMQLKQNNLMCNIPVVFVSANSGIKDIAREYNAQDHIAKPFEMKYLLDKVHAILFTDVITD